MVNVTKYFFCISCVLFFSVINAQDTVVIQTPPIIESNSDYDTEGSTGFYDRSEFGYYDTVPRIEERNIDEDALNQVRSDDAYWYANLEPVKKEKKPEIIVEKTSWVNTLFWILLIGGFLALVIWLLSSSNISLFRRSPKEIEAVLEEPQENIFELNFDMEIQTAINSQNYRLAVRLMFLQVLRIMTDKKIIRYAPEKTNSDYLFQVASTKYHKDFFKLARNFDFVWYGKFPVSAEDFEVLKKDFFTFKKSLG